MCSTGEVLWNSSGGCHVCSAQLRSPPGKSNGFKGPMAYANVDSCLMSPLLLRALIYRLPIILPVKGRGL